LHERSQASRATLSDSGYCRSVNSSKDSVRIENSTDYAVTAQDIAAANPIYTNLKEVAEGEAGATITIAEQNGAYVVSAEGGYSSGELSTLENAALSAFNAVRAGGGSFTSSVMTISEYRSPEKEGDQFTARFTVTYAYSILVMVLVMYSTSYIIRAVIEEKASKLVELLMISVKPLALILGKILASMCLVLIELVVIAVGVGGSILVSRFALHSTALMDMFTGSGTIAAIQNLNGASIAVILISILLGYFTFSIIGGISGACCSETDEMNKANMSVVLLVMGGYLASSVFAAFDSQAVAIATSIIPFVSVFSAPTRYMMGDISPILLIASWALQILLIIGLSAFGRRVYAALIMHRGERIKLKELFGMAKGGERA
jgi:ABC-type Na+ efflux pump permease subunit